VDPQIATKFTTLDFMMRDSISTQRFRALLIGSFAALGLLLAMIGVYGVMEYVVSQRTFEVGVRLTFGADPANIRRLILSQAMNLSLVGMAVGFVISIIAVQAVSSMLFGVPPRDPATFIGATVLLLATACLAAYVPARRAAAVDPMKAIRNE
jgi:ABC-type antimicrobial peptide transport system permease subunit